MQIIIFDIKYMIIIRIYNNTLFSTDLFSSTSNLGPFYQSFAQLEFHPNFPRNSEFPTRKHQYSKDKIKIYIKTVKKSNLLKESMQIFN